MNVDEAREKVRELEGDIERAKTSLREYERMIFRCAALSQRFFGSGRLSQIISMAIRAISVLRMLRISLLLLHTATGPVGWITAGAGLATGALMTGDLMMELGSG